MSSFLFLCVGRSLYQGHGALAKERSDWQVVPSLTARSQSPTWLQGRTAALSATMNQTASAICFARNGGTALPTWVYC